MAYITLAVTPAQLQVLQQLDAVNTPANVMQIHVDTWLAPLVSDLGEIERRDVLAAYRAATPDVRQRVKTELGLD